jgi:signal peptidase II
MKLFFYFLIPLSIDLITKHFEHFFYSLSHTQSALKSYFGFEPFYNSGFLLSALNETSLFARLIFSTTLFGFLIFLYFIFLNFIPQNLISLKKHITILFSSISSNSIEKIVHGYVTDFIYIQVHNIRFHFNFADIMILIAFLGIIFNASKNQNLLWHPNSKRNTWLINTKYQINWSLRGSLISLCASALLFLFSYTYFFYGSDLKLNPKIYTLCMIILSLIMASISFVFILFLSHRSAGPIFAFKKYIEQYINETIENKNSNKENLNFNLRTTDELQELKTIAEKIKSLIKKIEEAK